MKIHGIVRIGGDWEVSTTSTGKQFAKNFVLEGRKKDGKWINDLYNVTVWGKSVDFVQKYFPKGSDAYLEDGTLTVNEWQPKDSTTKRRDYSIIINSINFLPRAKSDQTQQTVTPEVAAANDYF